MSPAYPLKIPKPKLLQQPLILHSNSPLPGTTFVYYTRTIMIDTTQGDTSYYTYLDGLQYPHKTLSLQQFIIIIYTRAL